MSTIKDKVIAIDGPSGSGKSTIAKMIAEKLGFTYLDTGAMFRAIGYKLSDLNLDLSESTLSAKDQSRVENYLQNINFEYGVSKEILIRIDGQDLTSIIREHNVSKMASTYSKYSVIRKFLAKIQREIALEKPSVLEGRDIGTVIFPNAALKVFLTASAETRAKRRYEQLIEKDPQNAKKYNLKLIEQDVVSRDNEDSKRDIAPLKKASDAIEIDTTLMSITEVCNTIISEYESRKDLF